MKWLGVSGAVFAGLVLAGVGFTFLALMVRMALAGINLFRAPNHAAIFVFLTSGTPLVLIWALVRLSPD